MPGLSDHALHVDTAEVTGRNVHCDRIEPLPHRPAETINRCRD